MSSVSDFANIVREFAVENLGHSESSPHFSTNIDGAQNSFGKKMQYPCIVMDFGDFNLSTNGGQIMKNRNITIIFVDHVKDTANEDETASVFNNMENICDSFILMIDEKRKHQMTTYPYLARLSFDGVEGERIQLDSPALYGWALTLEYMERVCVSN